MILKFENVTVLEQSIGLLGNNGGKIAKIVDVSIIIPSTSRIQEAHRTVYHIICELVECDIISNKH